MPKACLNSWIIRDLTFDNGLRQLREWFRVKIFKIIKHKMYSKDKEILERKSVISLMITK